MEECRLSVQNKKKFGVRTSTLIHSAFLCIAEKIKIAILRIFCKKNFAISEICCTFAADLQFIINV